MDQSFDNLSTDIMRHIYYTYLETDFEEFPSRTEITALANMCNVNKDTRKVCDVTFRNLFLKYFLYERKVFQDKDWQYNFLFMYSLGLRNVVSYHDMRRFIYEVVEQLSNTMRVANNRTKENIVQQLHHLINNTYFETIEDYSAGIYTLFDDIMEIIS